MKHIEYIKKCARNLSQEFNMERKVIAFHLITLEKAGFVNSEFGIIIKDLLL
ncbi:MAG TPA: hypothetical protein VF222_07325 [Nitrososphaeraceae archaeon]